VAAARAVVRVEKGTMAVAALGVGMEAAVSAVATAAADRAAAGRGRAAARARSAMVRSSVVAERAAKILRQKGQRQNPQKKKRIQ
jgi:hypothetical protein